MNHPLVEDIEFYLRRISILIRHHTRELLAEYGLTLPQYYALIHLRDRRLTMGELCGKLFLASSTVTDLVDRMERQKLVRRLRDEKDRRVIHLEILEDGRKMIDEVIRDRLVFLSERLAKMEDQKAEELLETLSEFYRIMEEE